MRFMHSPIAILTAFFIFSMAVSHAEIPQVLNYQGKVTDTGGVPVSDGDYSMTFTLYDAETSGTSLWSSGGMTVTVSGGVFSVLMGDTGQPALSLDFDEDYWVEVEIEGDVQSPRMRIGSGGYAYMASGIVPGTEMIDTRNTPIFRGTNYGNGAGLRGDSDLGMGVRGETNATDGKGVYGAANSTTGTNYGVYGFSESTGGVGVYGEATATTGVNYGIRGVHASTNGAAVIGLANGTSGVASGVIGYTDSPMGYGVSGRTTSSSGLNYGVYGFSNSSEGIGVYGIGNAASGTNYGVYGETNSSDGFAGYFAGRTRVTGDLTVTSGGYLGIGTNNPSNPLVVSSPESDTPGDGAHVKLRDSSNGNHAFALRIGSTGAADLHLDSYYGAWQTLATIDRENGRVGLGTDTPDRDLSVVGYVRASYDVDETEYTEIYHGGGNGFINWNGDGNFDIRYATDAKVTVKQDGNVGIGTTNPGATLDVRGTAVFNEGGGDNDFRIEGQSKPNLFFLDASEDKIGLGKNSPAVMLDVDGWAAFTRVGIGTTSPGQALDVVGYIQNKTASGDLLTKLWMDENSAGDISVYGPNGEKNFSVVSRSGYPNHGNAYVCNSLGQGMAGMFVNASGEGVVFGDTKNFRMANPNQPDTEIWYACIEGPEAAAYIRGTARLENGRAFIPFPDHFKAVATVEGMTVQVTPLSMESEGLVVTKKSIQGIEVRELRSGTGTYDFDYTVMAVRDGYQKYEVIRPKEDERLAELPE